MFLSVQEECCGAYNYTDYAAIGYSQTIEVVTSIDAKVPVSCCKKVAGTGDVPSSTTEFQNLEQCLTGNAAFINDQVVCD